MVGFETDVRRRMLDAAREEFLGSDYDVLAGIAVTKVARRAGVPERTAKRLFKTGELRAALMEDLLRVRPREDIDSKDLIKFAGDLMDRSSTLADGLGDVADAVFERNIESDLFRSTSVFWALGRTDPAIEKRLGLLYEQWIRGARDGLNAVVAQHHDCLRLRVDWISVEDFVRAMIAVLEGLAIQESINRSIANSLDETSTDLQQMDDKLPRRVMLALFASMLDSSETARTEDTLLAVEERRQA